MHLSFRAKDLSVAVRAGAIGTAAQALCLLWVKSGSTAHRDVRLLS